MQENDRIIYMKPPFETEKVRQSTFLNKEDQESYQKLCSLVNDGDEDGVDKWFGERNEYLGAMGRENLAKVIANSIGLIRVKTTFGSSREDLKKQEAWLNILLLKNFNAEDQITILTKEWRLENKDIIRFVFETAKKEKKENLFYKCDRITDSFFHFFSKEDFKSIKEIEYFTGKCLLDITRERFPLIKENGCSYFSLDTERSILDEIILNYSDEKRDFIQSYNRSLPTKEDAFKLLREIKESYKKRDFITPHDIETLNMVEQGVGRYIKSIMYLDMKKTLPEKMSKETRPKI